jgi:hypothetical protein
VTKKQAPETDAAQPKKAPKKRAKAKKKLAEATGTPDPMLGHRFKHRTRSEWGTGTVVDGAENALVLSWSDGVVRRTARSYMDQLIAVP